MSIMKERDRLMYDEMLLNKLREVLLREDRAALHNLQDIINDPEKMARIVNPLIEYRISLLRQQFPKEYEREVTKIIEFQLKNSQENLLNIVYPVLGKMIRKYISQQFQDLKDSLDDQIRNTFSSKGLVGRVRALFFGVRDSEFLLRELESAHIEEIYVIEKNSGLLRGSYSRAQTIDQEVIAGMLTAIKAFVEDAFQRESEELELIQYGTYKIFIQSFHSYYISIILSGSLSSTEKDAISGKVLDFAETVLNPIWRKNGELDPQEVSVQLKKYFE